MSEILWNGEDGLVKNVCIYDLYESVKASKYPMSTDNSALNTSVTATVKKLAGSPVGSGDDNFLNGVRVAFDLTFSNKAWVEMERYHFMDFVSSQSTMHRIANFDIASHCNSYVAPEIIEIVQKYVEEYKKLKEVPILDSLQETVKRADELKEAYLKILYNVPSGFQLTARMTTNYRQLKTIYFQRRNHRLPEWRKFCAWIETLPYFKEWITDAK